MNNVIIKPYVSVGAIKFGETTDDVISTVGSPELIKTNKKGETEFNYSWGMVRFSNKPLSVVEVTIFPGMDVFVEGIDLFNESNPLQKLAKFESQAFECVGFLFLLDLGIILSGFHKKETEKIITIFERGRVDHLRDQFKLFKL